MEEYPISVANIRWGVCTHLHRIHIYPSNPKREKGKEGSQRHPPLLVEVWSVNLRGGERGRVGFASESTMGPFLKVKNEILAEEVEK